MEITLQAKLAAVVVHADELLSADGHELDKVALQGLVKDPEIVEWVKSMGALAPVKRNNPSSLKEYWDREYQKQEIG